MPSGATSSLRYSRLQRPPREVIEKLHHVLGEVGLAGHQAQVGVDARGLRVVIPGADVDVAAHAFGFLADDQRGLRVRLEPDDAVHDVDAGLLQRLRPVDVALLLEPRLELDEADDLLAGLGRRG